MISLIEQPREHFIRTELYKKLYLRFRDAFEEHNNGSSYNGCAEIILRRFFLSLIGELETVLPILIKIK